MDNNLQQIRNKLINAALLGATIFVIPAVFSSLLRTLQTGWQWIYLLHFILTILVILLYFFRAKLSTAFKVHSVSSIFIIIGLVGAAKFSLSSGFAIILPPIIITTLIFGRRLGFLYFALVILGTAIIAIFQVNKLIPTDIDFNVYNFNITSWLNVILSLAFMMMIIIYSLGLFFNYFIRNINELTKKSTEQEVVKNELQKNEKKFRAVFENANDLIFLILDGKIVECNSMTCKTFQCTEAGIIGLSPADVSPEFQPDGQTSKDKAIVLLNSVLEGKSEFFEWKHTKFNGEFFDAEVSLNKLNINDENYVLAIIRDVTDRKQNEKQLHDNEKRLSYALNATSDSIWDWNFATGETYYSPRWFEMLGYENQEFEMNFEAWQTLCHPDDYGATAQKIHEVLVNQKDKGYEAEFRMKNKTGDWVWILGRGNVIERKPNGDPLMLSGTNTLIDDRKKAEIALIQNEAHLNTLIDTIPDLVWLKDENGVYLHCNQRFEQFFGASKHEIIGKTDYDFIDKELADFFREKDKLAIILEKPSVNEEIVTFANDGHTELLETIKTPVYRKDGYLIGVLGIGHDITKRKHTENALRESKDKFTKIFDKAPVFISISDAKDGTYIDINEFALTLTGYSEQEVIGRKSSELAWLSPENIALLTKLFMENGKIEGLELPVLTKNGNTVYGLVKSEQLFIENRECILTITTDITALKQAEIALKENQRFVELITEQSPDIIYVYDIETNHNIFINKNLRELLNYKKGEVPEDSYELIELLIHHDDLNQFYEYDELVKNWDTEYIHQFEYRLKAANGEWHWFLGREKEFQRHNNKIITLIGLVSDITHRKKAELELIAAKEKAQENERRFELAVKGSNDGIWDWNLETNEHYFSPKWKQQIGYSDHELENSSSSFENNLHPDDKPYVLEYLNNYLNNKIDKYDVEFRLRHKDGSYRWIYARGEALRNETGKPVRMSGSHSDVTKRRLADEALKASEEQYRTLYESMIDAYVAVNKTGHITQFNKAYSDMLGYSNDELFKLTYKDITPKQWHQFEYEIFKKQVVKKGYSDIYEKEYRRKNGEIFPVELRTYLIKDNDGKPKGMWAIIRDITQRKQIEFELKNHRNHLEELVKTRTEELLEAKMNAEAANLAKSEFLSNMSHELRTPLNAILGFSKILKCQKNITEPQKEQLTTVFDCGEHLLSLINDILDMSKIEAQKLELTTGEVNLPEILHTVFNINKVKADEKDLEYVLEKNVSLPRYVLGDERKLKQIMLNLINNAIKFTDEGRITIRVDFVAAENTFIFEVEDTGIGIPQEKQDEIFKPFIQHTGKRLFAEGTGLGLSITKNLIEMMDGTIALTSEPETGSRFRVEIPLKSIDDKDSSTQLADIEVKGYRGERKNILIVDDNQSNVLLLVSLLEPIGFKVETAVDGQMAIEIMNAFKPDIILLDYRMPVMNGLEFARIIRHNSEFDSIKIIGVSATVHQKELKKQFHDICDDFIPKPVDIELLFNKMKAMLQMEWIYENKQQRNEKVEIGQFISPASDVIVQIKELAEIGNFNALNEFIDNLLTSGNDYGAFCSMLKKYAKNYDSEGIVQFIENLG